MRRTFPLVLLIVAVGCQATRPQPRTGPERARALAGFPATALVPPSATAVVAVRRLATLSEFLRGAVEPLRILDPRRTADGLDQELRRDLGLSPLELNDLEDAGFDGAGDLVVFAVGASPTVALKIGDEARLTKFLAERTKAVTTYLKQHRGHAVTSWNYSPRTRGSFVTLRGYFLLHLEELAADAGEAKAAGWGGRIGAPADAGMAWLDAILDAGSGAPEAGLGWLLARSSGENRDLVAYLSPAKIAAASKAVQGKGRRTECAKLDAGVAGIARAGAALRLQKRALRAQVVVELEPAARKELEDQAEKGVALPRALFAKAPLRAEWRLSPSYLATLTGRFASRDCGPPYTWIAEYLASTRLADLVRRNGGFLNQIGGALSAALFASDEKGQGTFVIRGALVARCKGAAIDYVRRALPIGSDKERVAGREVERVTPRERTLQERVRVLLADDLLRLTSGEDLMDVVLTAPAPTPAALVSIQLEPGKVADLRSLLKLLEDQPAAPSPWGGYYGRQQAEELDQLANLLSSYAKLRLDARLQGATLDLELEYRLR